ncbi:uncharacterized protein LOC111614839 [Centruroides sculpturatus]|uniref:uncharacterized protein LOC111614839 n=1 Tax=Centruroides sculpturatus TaxID=218467 RepID=UPI000C6EC79C|nr:uncharacterized protein LOC111614839 [Centruroides sculpturatus]
MPSDTIKVLQINTQKSQAATSLVVKSANDLNADIILIQEPYTVSNQIVRFGSWQVLNKGAANERSKCGIIVCNKSISLALIPELSLNQITTAALHEGPVDNIICIYFSPFDKDEECINELTSVVRKLGNNTFIVARDRNAKSHLWYHEREDNRGRLLQDLLNEIDNISLNMSDTPTFQTARAKGWTDVCLAPTEVGRKVISCQTLLKDSASNHRYILTILEKDQSTTESHDNYYSKRTNWELFQEMFARNWRNYRFTEISSIT